MAVAASDVKIYLTGAASDGAAQTDPALSLGNYRSATLKDGTTTLNGTITSGDTTIVATSASGAGLATGSKFSLDNEIILGGPLSTNTFTGCTRGQDGTSAAAHTTLVPMIKVLSANFLPAITGDQEAAGYTDYHCYAVRNEAASTASAVVIYLGKATGNAGDAISFAVEVPTGDASTGHAQGPVANVTTAPTVNTGNVSNWSTATTKAGGVAININGHSANMAQNNVVFVWIKRVITAATAAADTENYSIAVAFDSPA
jgi:hypothetical protein